jgi:DNA-binding CsgD family transcriptional regulator
VDELNPPAKREPLSGRERQVIAKIVDGKINKEIAKELGVSVETVKSHTMRIFAKLDVKTRAAAAAVWTRKPELVVTGIRVRGPDGEEVWLVPEVSDG